MTIVPFSSEHIEKARQLLLLNYREECAVNPILPQGIPMPDLSFFAAKGTGVAAFDNGRFVGFLCAWPPWQPSFYCNVKGTFCPLHGHGAIKENRRHIYQAMYENAAARWIELGVMYHGVCLYEHDAEGIRAFFEYGFGKRCMDDIRPMISFRDILHTELSFEELPHDRFPELRPLRRQLSDHFSKSPCFMKDRADQYARWLASKESGKGRSFIASDNKQPIAFLDIADEGENFITKYSNIKNIQGAFCVPEYRGRQIFQDLLEFVIRKLQSEGVSRLGVDHESINPTANRFWPKYFRPYTCSVTRRIDDSILWI